MKRISDFFVLLAQVIIGFIYVSFAGPWSENIVILLVGTVLIGTGIALGIRGIYDLRKSFAVHPKPHEKAEFIQTGIYSYVRHPMYSGLILVAIGFLLVRYSQDLLVMFFFAIGYLAIKIYIEERFLNSFFEDYREYSKKTGCIFPKRLYRV